MAAMEGVQRLYTLARRITFYGFIAALVLWALPMLFRIHFGLGELFLLLTFPLALGAVLWAIAWIIEGFVLPPKDS
jgi:hypothetical protein